jgi:single-strand DNA-binding protein
MARDLNRAQLIGRLTRDPELRYTPSGAAVCSFGIATNRSWTTDTGEKREEVDFHNIVAWNKLAEICSQYLGKGRRAYVEGRLATRSWTGQDGQQKSRTEIVIDDMIILDSKNASSGGGDQDGGQVQNPVAGKQRSQRSSPKNKPVAEEKNESGQKGENNSDEEVSPDDIPF